MDNKQQTLIDQKSKNQDLTNNKKLLLGSIVATLIAITPFVFNLHKSVPEIKVWDTYLFVYDSKYYEDVSVIAWTLMNKTIPLFLLLIWFFTNRHWWYHTLLVPISMYIYQIIITLNSDLYFVDGNEVIYTLPFMIIIIPSIYLVRAKIFNTINTVGKSTQDLEDELTFRPKTFWGKVKQYF